jgi:hypothetical protein
MKRKRYLFILAAGFMMAGSLMSGCTKEGPAGKDGVDGADGTAGLDGTATCIECHSPEVIEKAAVEYQHSKHKYGTAAFDEAGRAACVPCHVSLGFQYVVENNIPATFTLNEATSKYVNNYEAAPHALFGEIDCRTCHSDIHTTYTTGDLALTTVAPVDLTMWGGTKTADVPADGGGGNLCIKCHQPRPVTKASDGNVIDYEALASNPSGIAYDPTPGASNLVRPSYRTGVHYATVAVIYTGVGGVEFPGTPYTNTIHSAIASCQDCHMAPMQGTSGGHTFFARGNFNGCNADGCHNGVDATSASFWTGPRSDIKAKLDQLAEALTIDGVDIMSRNPDTDHNLWAANTTNKYDGYLNLYDPITNPHGVDDNPNGIFRNPAPSNSWSDDQKAFNATLPALSLTNAQLGGIINFQLVLRDYSQGIHNYKYTKALLENTIAAL